MCCKLLTEYPDNENGGNSAVQLDMVKIKQNIQKVNKFIHVREKFN